MIIVGVDRLAAYRYCDYKNKAQKHYEEHVPTAPFGTDNWQKCVDLFTNLRFIISITFILHYTLHFNFFANLFNMFIYLFIFCRNVPRKTKLIDLSQSMVVCKTQRCFLLFATKVTLNFRFIKCYL